MSTAAVGHRTGAAAARADTDSHLRTAVPSREAPGRAVPDGLLARWDVQQAAYIADREGRFAALLDADLAGDARPAAVRDVLGGDAPTAVVSSTDYVVLARRDRHPLPPERETR